MKTIKRIQLKDAALMTDAEMKLLFGGSGNSDGCSASQEECDTGAACNVGGTESGTCAYEQGPGCHCKLVSTGTGSEGPSGSDNSSDSDGYYD